MNHPCDTDLLQDAELAVLQVLWEAGEPLPLACILSALHARRGWADSTVKTLLRRLVEKRAVRLEKRGVYAAAIAERDYHGTANRSFLDKLYQGSAKNLVASLVREGRLTADDVADLTAMFRKEC